MTYYGLVVSPRLFWRTSGESVKIGNERGIFIKNSMYFCGYDGIVGWVELRIEDEEKESSGYVDWS